MANSKKHPVKASSSTWLIDPLEATRARAAKRYAFTSSARSWLLPTALGIALLVFSAVGWFIDPAQFYFSYLVGWTFCLTLSIGALFFVLFEHLSRSWWSVVVRRIAESLLWGFPLLAVLSIPWLLGMHDLYHWTHEGLDEVVAGKTAYLNTPFFLARLAVYFVFWTFLSHRLYTLSVRHDAEPDTGTPASLRKTSAWGLPLMAITTAFASYDLLMSLDPHWFSTIFGVYFFAGAIFAALALIALVALALQRFGSMLEDTVTLEHYQDLGKLMFGFTVFWAYIAFSQYMLIWYAGLPEETLWYQHRLEHGWQWHSALLLVLHFVVPFFLLLPRFTKRIRSFMAFMSVWFLVMQWFDLHWIAMPVLREAGGFHWLDFTCWLGLAALFAGAFLYRFGRHPIVPQRDPHLKESLHFQNV